MAVIIIASRPPSSLYRTLESMSVFLDDGIEIIVVCNGDEEYASGQGPAGRHKNIKYIRLAGKVSVGKARNEAIRQSEGEVLYFLDDDVIADNDIFRLAMDEFNAHSDIGVIGGPNLTPPGSSFFQKCSGMVLASVFGSAHARFRYKKARERMPADDSSLIACNLAVKRSVLEKTGLFFNEAVIRNEENLLLGALGAMGIRMLYMPELFVYHERRSNAAELFLQIFRYGRGRAQQTICLPHTLSLFNMLPSLLIIYVCLLPLFHRNPLYYAPGFLYILLDLVFSAGLGLSSRNLLYGLCSFWLFPLVHIAYGAGFLRSMAANLWK